MLHEYSLYRIGKGYKMNKIAKLNKNHTYIFSQMCLRGLLTCLLICLMIMGMSRQTQAASSKNANQSLDSLNYYGSSSFVTDMKKAIKGESLSASGKTYYVSTKGSDKAVGSQAKPFRTIKRAIKALKAGDTLLIRGGTYKERITVNRSGKKNQYITIANYPGESVCLSGGNRKASDQRLLKVTGSYLCIRGIKIANLIGKNAWGVAVMPGASNIILQNLTIQNIKVSGSENSANAIAMMGNNSGKAIDDVLVYHCKISKCKTGRSEAISVSGNATDINVIGNTVTATGNIGICIYGNYGYCKKKSVDFPRGCLIAKNTVKKCKAGYATAFGIYVDGGQNVTIDSNKVSGCGGGIEVGAEKRPSSSAYQTKNVKVLNNTLTSNVEAAIAVGGFEKSRGNVDSVTIKGNTCLQNGLKEENVLLLTKCSNVKVSNNVFNSSKSHGKTSVICSEMSGAYTKNVTFSNNVYHNGGSANDTSFIWHNKVYWSFKKWKSAMKDSGSVYKK